jgi:Tfp pilus assembly protein PilN
MMCLAETRQAMDENGFQIFGAIMQYIVLPVAGFVWLIFVKQQTHATAIAVLQAESLTAKQAHDREIKEIKDTTRAIFAKLDSIEEALRK